MGTMCVQSKTLWPTLKGCKWDKVKVVLQKNEAGIYISPLIELDYRYRTAPVDFETGDWSQECCNSNNIVGVILFLLCCTLLVPNLKNTALIFLELLSILSVVLF